MIHYVVARAFKRRSEQGPPCEGEYIYLVSPVFSNHPSTMTEAEYSQFKREVFIETWRIPAPDVQYGDYENWGGDC
jgi:hypothetical protein